jgi:hypothetical protein
MRFKTLLVYQLRLPLRLIHCEAMTGAVESPLGVRLEARLGPSSLCRPSAGMPPLNSKSRYSTVLLSILQRGRFKALRTAATAVPNGIAT